MKTSIKIIAIASAAVVLAGCGTTEQYNMYAETQKSIAQANAMAETARYAALAEIAKTGDPGARVAAVMSINFGAQGGNGPRVQQVAPPKTFGDTALQWTSVLLPSLTNLYGISANRSIATTQSNNAAATAASTNAAFVGMASNIQAPQASVTTTTTIGGNQNTGANSGNSGRIAGSDQTDNTSVPTVVDQVTTTTTTNSTTSTTTP